MTGVEAGCCRVEPAVESSRPTAEMLGQGVLVRALRYQPTPREIIDDVHAHEVILAYLVSPSPGD
jgi:hypothetical protein